MGATQCQKIQWKIHYIVLSVLFFFLKKNKFQTKNNSLIIFKLKTIRSSVYGLDNDDYEEEIKNYKALYI